MTKKNTDRLSATDAADPSRRGFFRVLGGTAGAGLLTLLLPAESALAEQHKRQSPTDQPHPNVEGWLCCKGSAASDCAPCPGTPVRYWCVDYGRCGGNFCGCMPPGSGDPCFTLPCPGSATK